MKSVLTSVICLSISAAAMAAPIKGVVIDSNTNEELIGAAVSIKGYANRGTVTGLDGSFVLNHDIGHNVILVCSYMGYKPLEIKISGNEKITIKLTPETIELDDITITAQMSRNSDRGARFLEKQSVNLVNIVSAHSIEASPDLNVANVLQRVSGVTLEKNSSGEGQYAVLRGMDKRYNYTLVNGIKIPSPDNKNRFVPLNIFPSELLDRLEVTKSLTADMEGDAAGGAINMVMKDAPQKRSFQVSASTGYNDTYFNQDFLSFDKSNITKESPRSKYGKDYSASISDFNSGTANISKGQAMPDMLFGAMYGERFFDNHFGLIVAGSYQNMNRHNNSIFFTDVMNQTETSVRLSSMKKRQYYENRQQYGAHAKVDYIFNNKHKVEWYNAFIGSINSQIRQSTDTDLSLNYDPEAGNSIDNIQTRSRINNQEIFSSTLQGEHKIPLNVTIDWSAVYSFATNETPDNTYINLENYRQNFNDYITADNMERRWEDNSDHDMSGYLNLTQLSKIGSVQLTSKFGGLVRRKERQNNYVSYTFTPASSSRPVMGQDFEELFDIDWKVSAPKGSVGPLNYKAGEDIEAFYISEVIDLKKWQFILGVRAEHTLQSYTMEYPAAGDDPYGEQNYWDILPSVNVKYMPNNKMNLRASYFKSINRPGFFEVVPYTIINEDYTEFGNKDLQRAKIENVDVRFEYFPSSSEQFMVGAFYKRIENPIEEAYRTVNNRQFGYGPVNLGNAVNLGFEVDMIKYFRNFGVKANYTYTHSAITTPKTLYQKDENGKLQRLEVDQTRPLVGQTPHVANLALLYKSTKYNIDAQVAMAYNGEKIVIASHYLDSDYWEEGSFSLDCSIEKRFKCGLSIFGKASNLLDTPTRRYIKSVNEYNFGFEKQTNDKTLIREDYNGRNILVGLRFRL